jgi:hypothetical protein
MIKGPYGFIPTTTGLSSISRLDNSLSLSSIDMLLASIDRTLFDIAAKEWDREFSSCKVKIAALETYVHSPVGEWVRVTDSKFSHFVSDIPLEQSFIY